MCIYILGLFNVICHICRNQNYYIYIWFDFIDEISNKVVINLKYELRWLYHHQHVPKAFAEETGIARQTQVILQDLRGREWTVEIDSNRRELYNRICLSRGWNHFRKANGLVFGTVCWFEFDPSSGNLVLTNRPTKTSSVDMVINLIWHLLIKSSHLISFYFY